ncbi:MAG: tetratricopeptide repeat protein, partial [Ruminococcus sp.]|nr:tetratricopeptide repeat protein [Ruminococcus sp.]
MKQLTCEMCGSIDLLKQDGVFVCQTCGTKYSVEEAKKMMIEGTVEVSGTVKVDNTDKLKNYLEMAESAYQAGNKGEAETYCNRVIEIEPQNYKAWFMKGKVAGWQSTLANVRFEESVQCFSKSIDYAPESEIEEIKKNATAEITELSLALINLS